jgi:DNA-binding NarL/FixJ family response regulator
MADLRIILAEPSFMVRKGLSAIVAEIPGMRMIREIEDKDQLTAEIEQSDPDFIIINPDLFVSPDCKAPLSYVPPGYRKKTIGLFNGRKECSAFKFLEIIYLRDGKSTIIEKLRKVATTSSSSGISKADLEISEREKLVVKYVALGLTNKEIAEKLFISTHTVITHRKNITRKLGIKTVSGLTIYAIMNNLIELEEIK